MPGPQSSMPLPDLFGYVRSAPAAQKLASSPAPSLSATTEQLLELSDSDLARWAAVLVQELERRLAAGRSRPDLDQVVEEATVVLERLRPRRHERRTSGKQETLPILSGKRNAIRAALSAGVRPRQVAKHFRLSLADVRKIAAEPG